MVFGLSNNPIEALKKGLPKKEGSSPMTPVPMQSTVPMQSVNPTPLKAVVKPTIPSQSYGGFEGITKPLGQTAINPSGLGANTVATNFPKNVQQQIGIQVAQSTTQPIKQAGASSTIQGSLGTIDINKTLTELQADIKAGMPVEEMKTYYPEINEQTQTELYNDIKAGMPIEEATKFYPELTAGQVQEMIQGGGVKGISARTSPIDMGKAEWLNPVGRVMEIVDDATQKIPTVTGEKLESKRQERIKNITEEQRDAFEEKFNSSKLLQGMYGSVDNYIAESQKTFLDQIMGTGEDGPNVAKMILNIPASTVKTVSAITRAITNPADTLAGLGKIIFTKEGRQAIVQRYGSWDNFAETLNNDPVGVASDVLAAAEGGASLVKGGAKLVGATNTAAKVGNFQKVVGSASDLGVRQAIPAGFNALKTATKVSSNANPLLKAPGAAVKYAEAATKPLDTFVNGAKWVGNELPTAEGTIQRMNRLTAGDQRKFYTQQGKTEGQWLNDTIGPKTPTETVYDLGDRIKNNLNKVDSASDTIKGPQKFKPVEYTTKDGDVVKYEGDAIRDMGEDAVGYAERTGDPRAKVMQGILDKYNAGQAEFKDINKLHRYYQANTRMGYFKDLTAGEKTVKSTNIDSAVREWKIQTAIKNGFDNLREINKDTQASMFIVKALEKAEQGRLGNNAVSLTDWIVAAPAMLEPSLLVGLVTKKISQSNWFTKNYAKIINKINGHKTQADKAVDLAKISRFQSEKEFQNWLKGGQLKNPALPMKEGVGETPRTIITPGKTIIGTDKGLVREGQILEYNNVKNDTSNPSSDSSPSNTKTQGKTKLAPKKVEPVKAKVEPLPNKNNPLVKNKIEKPNDISVRKPTIMM